MGIKERRQRQIEALKADILKAARQLAIRKGWPYVSIRKIAEIIEYTPPVIYEHFQNKEAILAELEALGFKELKHNLEEAQRSEKEADQQLLKLSQAYWDFAIHHKELYQVMFNLEGTRSTPPSTQAIREAGAPVLEALQPLHTFPAERESLFFNWWALAHGFVSLHMSGELPHMKTELRKLFEEAVSRLIKNMV